MARISTYPIGTAALTDEVIGTGADKTTKNFTLQSIIDLVPAPVGGGTVTSVSVTDTLLGGAFSTSVANPTTTPDITLSTVGTATQYIAGDGSLATIASIPGTVYTGGDGIAVSGTNVISADLGGNTTTETPVAATTTALRTYQAASDANNNIVVNVPWTDSGGYTLPVATDVSLGGIELGSSTPLTAVYETGSAGSATRTYPLQLNSGNQAAVTVPWTDTNSTYTAGDGLTLNTLEFDANINTTVSPVPESLSTTASQTYQIQLDDQSQNLVVNVPWVNTNINTTYDYLAVGSIPTGTVNAPPMGTGYSSAINVATTGGSGTGMTVDTTVVAGGVQIVTINDPGTGYQIGDNNIIISGGDSGAIMSLSGDVGETNPNLRLVDSTFAFDDVKLTGGSNVTITRTGNTGITFTAVNTQNPFQTIAGTGSINTDSGILLSDGGGTVLIEGIGSITAAQNANIITLTGVNTWDANALSVAGYVAAPSITDANYIWKCDSSGNPAWRAETANPGGTVTSVAMIVPSALAVSGSPVTTSGTFTISGAGVATEYIKGDGTLGTTSDNDQSLAEVLAVNNITNGTDIVVSAGDVISGSLGSDALPSYTFTGDTNTGIYSPVADRVGISGGGVLGLTVDATDTVVEGNLTINGTFISGSTAQASFGGPVTIPITPTAGTDAASKGYVDTSNIGQSVFQGGYNALTNTPDLDVAPSASIKQGWFWAVTDSGTFFTETVQPGDLIYSNIDDPGATEANWTVAQSGQDIAGEGATDGATVKGISGFNSAHFNVTSNGWVSSDIYAGGANLGIVPAAGTGTTFLRGDGTWVVPTDTDTISTVTADATADRLGIEVTTVGTAVVVGLDIENLSPAASPLLGADEIPIYDSSIDENKKATLSQISTMVNLDRSYADTVTLITNTVTHGLSSVDLIVQLYDTVTGATVYADVVRTNILDVEVSFLVAPTNPVRVLIQKIG
jgi:hypothetical protein|tara:strand:+ start:36 stop:2930 length:2895 start_codon:yes stop_codon:yes gene_type:complete